MKIYILLQKDVWGEGMADTIEGVFSSHTAAIIYASKLEHGSKIIWEGLTAHYAPKYPRSYCPDRYEIKEEALDPIWWEDKEPDKDAIIK